MSVQHMPIVKIISRLRAAYFSTVKRKLHRSFFLKKKKSFQTKSIRSRYLNSRHHILEQAQNDMKCKTEKTRSFNFLLFSAIRADDDVCCCVFSFRVDDAGEHQVRAQTDLSSRLKGEKRKVFCNNSVYWIQSSAIDVSKENFNRQPQSLRNQNIKLFKVQINVDLRRFEIFLPVMHINAIHPSSPNSSQSEDDAATRIQAQWKGYRVRKQLRNSRKSKNGLQNGHHVERTSIEEKSATRIQASWKGFKTRKELKNCRIAATKIQAGWKGFKARKELKSRVGKEEKSK